MLPPGLRCSQHTLTKTSALQYFEMQEEIIQSNFDTLDSEKLNISDFNAFKLSSKFNINLSPDFLVLGTTPFVWGLNYYSGNPSYEIFQQADMSAYTDGLVWNGGPKRIHVKYEMSLQIAKLRYFRSKIKVFDSNDTQIRSTLYSGVGRSWYKDWDYPIYHQDSMIIDIKDGERVVLYTNYDIQTGDYDTNYPVECNIIVTEM